VDNHSHIILANIQDMVAAAKAKNIDRYSITEHVSQFKVIKESITFGSTHGEGRIFGDLDEYVSEFSRISESDLSGMKLLKGLEVDFSPRYAAKVGEFVNQEKWDILLCSIHELEDAADIEHPGPRAANPATAIELWYEYFRLEKSALESDFIPFKVLTHPTRMMKGVNRLPEDFDELLLDLAKTARRRDKALELNGKDIGYAPELVRRVAAACSKAGCKVSLGSDSHYPKDVFGNMEVATALMNEFKLQLI
jgi:HisJ family histidinol phosphate phosphatase